MEGSRYGLPDSIMQHLYNTAENFGLEPNEETIARLGAAWLEKRDAFDNLSIEKGMDDVGFFARSDERGALILTWSGSLVSIGPLTENSRRVEYASIGFRTDVPPSLSREGCVLSSYGEVDKCLTFAKGPIKQTSRIFRIAVCPEDLSAAQQGELLDAATSIIAESFTETNREALKKR